MLVGGTGIVNDGQIFGVSGNISFVDKNHRSDYRNSRAAHKRLGRKGIEPALKAHGKQKGFHNVVGMMSQRKLAESLLSENAVERAPSHFGAQAARI